MTSYDPNCLTPISGLLGTTDISRKIQAFLGDSAKTYVQQKNKFDRLKPHVHSKKEKLEGRYKWILRMHLSICMLKPISRQIHWYATG